MKKLILSTILINSCIFSFSLFGQNKVYSKNEKIEIKASNEVEVLTFNFDNHYTEESAKKIDIMMMKRSGVLSSKTNLENKTSIVTIKKGSNFDNLIEHYYEYVSNRCSVEQVKKANQNNN